MGSVCRVNLAFPAILSGVNGGGIGSLLVMVSLLYLQSANQNQRQHTS